MPEATGHKAAEACPHPSDLGDGTTAPCILGLDHDGPCWSGEAARRIAALASAPPNDPTHPAVVERLTKDMLATAAVLDASEARSFAADPHWDALLYLKVSVDKMIDEAELHRPHVAQGRT